MKCWQLWIVTTVFFWVANCGGSAKQTADLLYDVRAFNEGVRWQKFPQSAVRIMPEEREAFLDMREDLEEELQIDDFEITRMKRTGKDQGEAAVQIKWTWHLDSQGIVRTTTSSQNWKRYGKRWMMLEEVHVRGHKMPGLSEKTDEEEPSVPGDSDTSAASIRFQAFRSVKQALHMGQNPPTVTR